MQFGSSSSGGGSSSSNSSNSINLIQRSTRINNPGNIKMQYDVDSSLIGWKNKIVGTNYVTECDWNTWLFSNVYN